MFGWYHLTSEEYDSLMTSKGNFDNSQQALGLLYNVAEDLKVPFYRILNELTVGECDYGHSQAHIIAEASLKMLDSYLVSTQIYTGQQTLVIEPVSAHAILYDTGQQLSNLARLHNFDIQLNIQRNVGQIMANYQALQSAITSIGYSFLYNYDASKRNKKTLLLSLQAKQNRAEIGVYSSDSYLSANSLQRVRQLRGRARVPITEFSHGSSSGLIIADELFNVMATKMQASKFNNLRGVKASLLPSRQLSLI